MTLQDVNDVNDVMGYLAMVAPGLMMVVALWLGASVALAVLLLTQR